MQMKDDNYWIDWIRTTPLEIKFDLQPLSNLKGFSIIMKEFSQNDIQYSIFEKGINAISKTIHEKRNDLSFYLKTLLDQQKEESFFQAVDLSIN